jgi:tetratricopeptide (TPR) repeat protein
MLRTGDNFDEEKARETSLRSFLFGKNNKRRASENGGKRFFGIGYITKNEVTCKRFSRARKKGQLKMNRKQSNAFLTAISLVSLFINLAFIAPAQVGFTAEDISEGASVFVFRSSARQPKNAIRTEVLRARPIQKKNEARARRVRQSDLLGNAKRPVKPINPRPTPKPVKPDQALAAKEKSAETRAKSADALLANKNLDEAENLYSEARAISPNNQTAKLGLAKIYALRGDAAYENKNYKVALTHYAHSISFNPENADVHASLGETYAAQDEPDKAIASYSKALELDSDLTEINAPLGTLYYEKGDFSNAEKRLAKAVSGNSSDDDLQNLYGEVLLKQNRPAEAARAFQAALQINQNSHAAHYNLAKIYIAENRQNEAIAELRQAVKINNNYAEAHFDLGTLLYNNGQYEEAASRYREVLRINSANFEARRNLADSYRLLGKYSEAADEYGVAAPLVKKADVYSDFGYVLGKTRNWTRAAEMLKEAVRLEPNAFDYTNLSWAYNNAAVSAKNPALFEEAKRAAQEAIRLNPNFAAAYYNLGNAQAQTKDVAAALESYNQALKLRSNWAEANNNLGFAYATSGNHSRAIEEYRKALKIKPEFPEARFNLGVSLALDNKIKDAEDEMKLLNRLDPGRASQLARVIRDVKRKRPGK